MPLDRRAGDIADRDAGVERRHQQLLRVGRAVAAEQLARLVGDDLVAAGDALAADGEAVDDRLAAGLAGPAGGDVEADLGLAGVLLDRFDDFAERGEVEAVDAGFLTVSSMVSSPWCW